MNERSTLYQNAGYTVLNHAHVDAETRQIELDSDYSLAATFFDRALKVTEAYRSVSGLGFALLYQGKEEAALQTWAMMPVAMQDEMVAYGDRAMEMAQYETAVYWYEKALSLDGRSGVCPLLYRLGNAYEGMDAMDLAREQFLRCVQLGEEYVDAYVSLCFSYVDAGETNDAITLFSRLDKTMQDNSSLLTCIGVGYMNENEYDNALSYFSRAVTVDPQRASLHQWLSLAYTRLGVFTEAIRSAEQATMLDGSKIDYWYHLANLYRETGQEEAETAVLRKISALEEAQNN